MSNDPSPTQTPAPTTTPSNWKWIWNGIVWALPWIIGTAVAVLLLYFQPRMPAPLRHLIFGIAISVVFVLLYRAIKQAEFSTAPGKVEPPILLWLLGILVLGIGIGTVVTLLVKPGLLQPDTPIIGWILPELTGLEMPGEDDVTIVDNNTANIVTHAKYQTVVLLDDDKPIDLNPRNGAAPVTIGGKKRIRVYYYDKDSNVSGNYRQWFVPKCP